MRMQISTGTGRGMGGKVMFSGVGLFFAFIGMQSVKQEWADLQETKAMQLWTQTTCIIETCEVEDHGEDFRLNLAYRYELNGQSHSGSQYGRSKYYTAKSIGEIERARKKLRPGKTVDLYYNPADPSEAVLELPTVNDAKRSVAFTLFFPAFGILFAALPWLRGRKKGPAGKRDLTPKLFLIPFGSIFALFGLLMLKLMLIEPLQKIRDAETWNKVEAVVVSSKVKSHEGDDSTTYSPYIAYRYMVNGMEYFGDQYTFMGGSSSGYDNKAAIVRDYPKGREISIFINPANPSESVVNRDRSLSLLFGLIPLVFTLIGIAIIVGGFLAGKKSKLDRSPVREHIVALKGKSPAVKAVGFTLFTCIWAGVVFLIFQSDAPILFHIIFGFFGVVLVIAAIHSILAIFNPRPSVEITPGSIQPGTSAAMRWHINGRADRISRLNIALQCLKVTTETRRSGGEIKTRTVKTPIYEKELLQTESQLEIAQGTLQFTIPEERPVSRRGNTNGIQWKVVFHGDIDRWPDMQQEMDFTVYPEDRS